MTQEEKELILKDVGARIQYGLKCQVEYKDGEGWKNNVMTLEGVFSDEGYFTSSRGSIYSNEFKPILRKMSSMSEEEQIKFQQLKNQLVCQVNSADSGVWKINYIVDLDEDSIKIIDWLNEHHFDYRGLIENGLAIEDDKIYYN